MATEKDHRHLQLIVQEAAAMSSRSCSRRPKSGLQAGSEHELYSSARQDQSISGQSLTWEVGSKVVDPATPTGQLEDGAVKAPAQSTRSKASLMKKLSLLLHPGKKPKSKLSGDGSAQKPLLPLSTTHSAAAGGAGRELELLFAQAEATLGELLVRAGASFDARSTSHHAADHPSHARGRSINGDDVQATLLGSSSGRSAGLSTGQGHARRKSLSRVWQQLGGSLFCGSGHMNGYVTEEMPLPAHTSTSYSGSHAGVYEDVVLDEAYWQSVADAMLTQRHQDAKLADHEAKLPADITLHPQSQAIKEVQQAEGRHDAHHDFSFVIGSTQQQVGLHSGGVDEEVNGESEIVPSIDPAGSMCKWGAAVCGRSSSLDMDSMYQLYKNFTGVEGEGSTRLNTTLDDSPNLAHNYQLHMKMDSAVMSNSTSVQVKLLNYYSDVPAPAVEAASRPIINTQVEASPSMQPLERFLWQARGAGGGPPSSEEALNSSSPSSRSGAELINNCREPAAMELSGTTTSCRVSLMTLLHEEAAAIDSPATNSAVEARKEEEEAEEAAEELEAGAGGLQGRRRMTRLVGEDPLLCCVCMVRRKGAALIPCGHTFCRVCSKQLFAGRGACPLCNNLIVQVLDIF